MIRSHRERNVSMSKGPFRPQILVGVTLGMLTAVLTHAQSPATATGEARFEVASVKPSATTPSDLNRIAAANGGRLPNVSLGIRAQPGRMTATMMTLQSLILRAYGLKAYQLEGGPAWLTTDYFDIAAKAESDTATEAEMNQMLKPLLADRFGLRAHVETRQMPMYTLSLANSDGKLGSGLKKTSPECEAALDARKRTGAPLPPPPQPTSAESVITPVCGSTMMMLRARTGAATLVQGGLAFSVFVDRLTTELAAPIADKTGLTGLYDVVLDYESSRRPTGLPAPGLDPNSNDPAPVPLPTALQKQLGLKLEKTVGPLPMTVVDTAERPSAD